MGNMIVLFISFSIADQISKPDPVSLMNFPIRTNFASHQFCKVVIHCHLYLISSFISLWTHWFLVSCCLVSMYLFFCIFLSVWFPSFIVLGSEMTLEIISVLLNLVRLILWPGVSSVLENISCVLVQNVSSVFFGCSALKI